MTSKEALKELRAVAISKWGIERVKIIEKDLEVLEILKSCIEEKDGDYTTFHFSLCWYNKDKDNCKIYRKIKGVVRKWVIILLRRLKEIYFLKLKKSEKSRKKLIS